MTDKCTSLYQKLYVPHIYCLLTHNAKFLPLQNTNNGSNLYFAPRAAVADLLVPIPKSAPHAPNSLNKIYESSIMNMPSETKLFACFNLRATISEIQVNLHNTHGKR